MEQVIEYETFNQLKTIFENRNILFKRDFNKYVDVIEEIIIYSFNVHNTFVNELLNRGIEIDGIISQTLPLYLRNCHYLFSSYILLQKGLIHPGSALLRVVFESITHIYIYQLTTYEADLLYKHDTENLNESEENELIYKYRFFNPSIIRDILYNDETRDDIKIFYSAICKPAHPTTKGAMANFEYRIGDIEDSLKILLAVAFSSIVAIFEVFHNLVNTKEQKMLNEKLTLIARTIESMPLLIPNHPDLIDKIAINPRFE